jgi:hypothetical protein
MESKKIGKYTYYISDNPNKKLMVIVNGNKINFGQAGYEHYKDKTGLLDPKLNHGDKERRENYLKRARGIKDKEGKLTYKDPNSANYHAIRILW